MKNFSTVNSDVELIKAIGDGDHKAFKRLTDRYKNALLNFVYRYIWDMPAAEEITQEVFLRIYKAASEFKEIENSKVSTWIFKIAYNLSINELKRRKRYLRLLNDHESEKEMPDRTQALKSIENRELIETVFSELRLIPENQRAALLLKVNQELSYREISEVLNVSVSSVDMLIFRARKHLKQHINREYKG
jgi:RNA polymerase sigma-70 factor (ECF subfamily)